MEPKGISWLFIMIKQKKIPRPVFREPEKQDLYEVARRRMVQEQFVERGIKDERVLAAMQKVKRHLFVAKGMEAQAYLDRSLPIGEGQTISQPWMVAKQSELLQLKPDAKVLEIGTGSGYQTAVLAELAARVFTIERIQSLSVNARKVLYAQHCEHVTFRVGDGTLGWKEEAPFDGIIVTAGAPVVPEALCEQLKVGGCLVIPVGNEEEQELLRLTKTETGLKEERFGACRFVRLIGRQGWQEGKL